MPLSGIALKRSNFQCIGVGHISPKVVARKLKNISFAGIVRLVKSAMEDILIYPTVTKNNS